MTEVTENEKQEFRRDSRYEDPFGSDAVTLPLNEVMGPILDPAEMPENRIREGEQFYFGEDVAKVFEELVIPRQIPGYHEMRYRCLHIGHEFVQPHTDVLDIGTSRGKMIRDLIGSFVATNQPEKIDTVTYHGVDYEEAMLNQARKAMDDLFVGDMKRSAEDARRIVRLRQWDLREGIPASHERRGYSLITSVLTIQFVPIEHRLRIVSSIYEALNEGGAFVWVEKVIGNSVYTDDLMTKLYYDDKRRNGMDEEAIVKKRESLEGFLVPQRSNENRYMLEQAGFKPFFIETFWRDLQFEAIVAIKK